MSLSAALRDSSTTTVGSAARIVEPRRRPEIRPTSPKIDPCGIGTTFDGSSLSISTSTEPCAMAKSEVPGSLRRNTVWSLAKLATFDSSISSRSCNGETSLKMSICVPKVVSHSSTDRLPGSTANLPARIGSSAGLSVVLPLMNSTTS